MYDIFHSVGSSIRNSSLSSSTSDPIRSPYLAIASTTPNGYICLNGEELRKCVIYLSFRQGCELREEQLQVVVQNFPEAEMVL